MNVGCDYCAGGPEPDLTPKSVRPLKVGEHGTFLLCDKHYGMLTRLEAARMSHA